MMKKWLSAFILAGATLVGVTACSDNTQTNATTQQASNTKAAGVWIDVRTPEEYAEGHLQDAINVPYEQIANEIAKISPNKDAPVNLYCRTGRRAEVALNELKKLGYTNVTNHGGYQDLVAKGVK